MGKECRSTPRFDFGLKVVLLESGEVYFTKDISIKGCFIATKQPFQIKDSIELAIDVPGFGNLPIKAEVRHISDEGVGLFFPEIPDSRGKNIFEQFLQVVSLCDESPDSSGLSWL